MLETIFSWLTQAIGGALDMVVSIFLSMMQLSLGALVKLFPFLATGYNVFQAVGLGLTICIASMQLIKFLTGQTETMQDTPVAILIRSAVSVFMIWMGGYFVEMIVGLAQIPYNTIIQSDAITWGQPTFSNIVNANWTIDGLVIAGGGSALLLLLLILIIVIAWNLLQLIVEVCERYLLVGVLAYSAPLIYPTISSQGTMPIFQKWFGMFLGQCGLMTISAWMLKLVLSGFSFTEGDAAGPKLFFRLLLTLAMCKVAQRADTYLQQLGIGVGTTGGNMIGDLLTAAGAGRILTGQGGRQNSHASASGDTSVLGAGADGGLSRFSGLFGGAAGGALNAMQESVQQYKNGASRSEIMQNAAAAFVKGTGINAEAFGKAADEMKNAPTLGEKIKGAGKIVGHTVGGLTFGTLPIYKNVRDIQNARQEVLGNKNGESLTNQDKYQNPNGSGIAVSAPYISKDIQNEARKAGVFGAQYAKMNMESNGVGTMIREDDGTLKLDNTARRAGLSFSKNGHSIDDATDTLKKEDFEAARNETGLPNATNMPELIGSDEAKGMFIAKNYQEAAMNGNEDMQDLMTATIQNGSQLMAEEALLNPHTELEGNDKIGDQLIKNAIGEQAITGVSPDELGGTFYDIKTGKDENGNRMISFSYRPKDGAPKDDRAYEIRTGSTQANRAPEGMTALQAKGSGSQIYVRQRALSSEPFTPPTAQTSTQTPSPIPPQTPAQSPTQTPTPTATSTATPTQTATQTQPSGNDSQATAHNPAQTATSAPPSDTPSPTQDAQADSMNSGYAPPRVSNALEVEGENVLLPDDTEMVNAVAASQVMQEEGQTEEPINAQSTIVTYEAPQMMDEEFVTTGNDTAEMSSVPSDAPYSPHSVQQNEENVVSTEAQPTMTAYEAPQMIEEESVIVPNGTAFEQENLSNSTVSPTPQATTEEYTASSETITTATSHQPIITAEDAPQPISAMENTSQPISTTEDTHQPAITTEGNVQTTQRQPIITTEGNVQIPQHQPTITVEEVRQSTPIQTQAQPVTSVTEHFPTNSNTTRNVVVSEQQPSPSNHQSPSTIIHENVQTTRVVTDTSHTTTNNRGIVDQSAPPSPSTRAGMYGSSVSNDAETKKKNTSTNPLPKRGKRNRRN